MISTKTSKILCACLAAIGGFSLISPASAGVYSIDDFSITRTRSGTTTTVFQDNFNNGVAPASPPYFFTGAVGTESNGRYRFDTATGGIFDSTGGPGLVRVTDARFNPAVTVTNSSLSITDAFTVTGLFDLLTPNIPREGYGIRLGDAGIPSSNNMNDRLDLFVRRTSTNELAIQFRDLNSSLDITTTFGSFTLDSNHDQILLELSKLDAATNAITARFAYVDGGIVGAFNTFATTGTLFEGENFTRASFRATSPIPLPPTIFLSLIGLAALVSVRKLKA